MIQVSPVPIVTARVGKAGSCEGNGKKSLKENEVGNKDRSRLKNRLARRKIPLFTHGSELGMKTKAKIYVTYLCHLHDCAEER